MGETVKVLHRLQGHTGVIFDVRFLSGEGHDLASVSDDRTMRVWKKEGDEYVQERELYGHRARIWSVKETQNFYATVSEDATCKLWHKSGELGDASNKAFDTLKGHTGKNIRALATINDGKDIDILATGGEDGAIKIFDIKALQESKQKTEQLKNESSSESVMRLPLPDGSAPLNL